MATTDTAQLLRSPDAPKRATLLELLFDVVYVAAFALTSMRLATDLTWLAAAQTLIMLLAVWWTWSSNALLTNFYDPEQSPIQTIVTATMLGVILMAVAIPSAFSTHAGVFAGAYVGIHVVKGILLVSALRDQQARARAIRFMLWFMISAIGWIAGVLVENASIQLVLWTIAIAIDYSAGAARYPTPWPWPGRVPARQYDKAGEHYIERYRQVVILALGDLILVPTLKLNDAGFSLTRVVAFLVAFTMALLLWQFFAHGTGATSSVVAGPRPGAGLRLAPYTHFILVAGVVITVAGYEIVIVRPTGATPVGWVFVMLGGPALFLSARTLFEYVMLGELSRIRLLWMTALVAVGPAMVFLPPVFVTLVAAAIVLGIDVTEGPRFGRLLPKWLGAPAREPPKR